jgi:putative cell wall-binding protein
MSLSIGQWFHRTRQLLIVFLCLTLVISLAVIPAITAQALTYPSPEITRHAGADRYETAALASQKAFSDPAQVKSVIVVTGESFPDALAAAPFAELLNAPVFLTQSDSLSAAVTREILRLKPDHIYVLGKEGSVASEVETALTSLCPDVKRIGGEDRYQTAVLLAEVLAKTDGGTAPTEAFLVTGASFADALSVGAVASQLKAPILLTDANSLNAVTAEYLKTSDIKTVSIVGGTGTVAAEVEDELRAIGVTSIDRFGGVDRYDTAKLVIDHAIATHGFTPTAIGIVSGADFPDAVVAAADLGVRDGIVLLSEPASLSPYITALLTEPRDFPILSVELFGGTATLGERVESSVLATLHLVKTAETTGATLKRMPGVYAIDVNNLASVVGDADYVFVGLVNGEAGITYTESDVPDTKYEANVIINLKGNLGSEQISFAKSGGLSKDGERLLVMEEDYLPSVGEVYVFAAYAQPDGSLKVAGKNSNTLLLIDDADSLSISELTSLIEATQTYSEFINACENQTVSERPRSTYIKP